MCLILDSLRNEKHKEVYNLLDAFVHCEDDRDESSEEFCDSDCPGMLGWSSLHYACLIGDRKKILEIISRNPDLLQWLSGFRTKTSPLEVLVKHSAHIDFLDCFTLLLNLKLFDVHALNEEGSNLLHIACDCDNDVPHQVVAQLIDHCRVNINVQNNQGQFPMQLTVNMHILLQCMYANPSVDQLNHALLTGVASRRYTKQQENLLRIRFLISNGADPNFRDKSGNTVLHQMIKMIQPHHHPWILSKTVLYIKDSLAMFPSHVYVRNANGHSILDVFRGCGTSLPVPFNLHWMLILPFIQAGCPLESRTSAQNLPEVIRNKLNHVQLLLVFCAVNTLPRLFGGKRLPTELIRKLDGYF